MIAIGNCLRAAGRRKPSRQGTRWAWGGASNRAEQWSRTGLVHASLVSFVCAVGIAKADIIVTDWELRTSAADNTQDKSSYHTIREESITFPLDLTHSAVSGPTSAVTQFDFALGEDAATFDFDFSFVRSASRSWAQGYGYIVLVATQPMAYAFTGSLDMSGTGTLVLSARLVEAEHPNPHLYIGEHASWATPNEGFDLGIPGGDLGSTEAGDIAGTLTPHVDYVLFYDFELRNNPMTETTASADGFLSFAMTPEPSSVCFLGLGGLMLLKRKRST